MKRVEKLKHTFWNILTVTADFKIVDCNYANVGITTDSLNQYLQNWNKNLIHFL